MRAGLFCSLALALLLHAVSAMAETAKIDFWSAPRKGANMMNQVQTEADLAAAAALGIQFIRLAPDKWKSGARDFLIGDADHYAGLVPQDLAQLKKVLGWAADHHLKIVLTMLSLPGDRWKQLNGGRNDARLWQDKAYWRQAAAFWGDLAAALKDEPAIVAYNILNEPHPELGTGFQEEGSRDFAGWYAAAKGTPRDLNALYADIVAAIRQVDRTTPIMLDSGLYAAPDAFAYLVPMDDPAILYAFHMYEPYAFTAPANKGKYRYPGPVPFAGRTESWNRQRIAAYLDSVARWQTAHHIPADRIVASEFGCYRRNVSCRAYFTDLLAVLDGHAWPWAFYAFREDGWDGMDYEVGTGALPWKYWQAMEAGQHPAPPRSDNSLFQVLKREFAPAP